MKILDNNALHHIVKHQVTLREPCFVTPDIQDEYEAGTDDRLPTNVRPCFTHDQFDEGRFLKHYQTMLSVYSDRSFFNMRGFGDISILALLRTLKDAAVDLLPTLAEPVTVITGDEKLTKAIRNQFRDQSSEFDQKLVVQTPQEHFKADQ